ncbi:SMP-30/gluconolactonase/LRE family protein [Microbacteriaceae bacterium VKM Ac-2855]|nr:SMP-30/gluconolactonase/LRE family protein [Microbacteriaceae bacterium VKM Ac-2855]
MQPTVFRHARAILIESPFWDASSKRLIWVDISAGALHSSGLDGTDTVTQLPPPLSAVQPVDGGGFVASLGDRVVLLDAEGAQTRTLANIEHAHAGLRLNEGKCDPFGRFVVGSMNLTTGEPDGALYRVSADGRLETLLGGFGVANGFEWSDDGSTMYVTDTSVSTVFRLAYGPGDAIGEPEPFLVGRPSDGLALDTDGYFWNGCYGEGRVIRWTPDGEVDTEIEIPAPNVTGVAFGGDDMNTLFVGTAREKLTEQQLSDFPESGSLFAIATPARGRAVRAFAQPS